METIGIYKAKAKLSRLLERVANGEEITITKHGRPVATLKPSCTVKKMLVHDTIEQIKQFRRGNLLEGPSIQEMIGEGRR